MIYKPKKYFFNLVRGPRDTIFVNTLIQQPLQIIQLNQYTDISVILTTSAFRIFLSSIRILINKMNFQDIQNRNYNKYLLYDLKTEKEFYQMSEKQYQEQLKYLRPQEIISNLFNSFLILNFTRSLSYICQNPDQFQGFYYFHEFIKYDNTFVLPIIIIGLNYFNVINCNHPFLNNVKNNKILLFNLSFMAGISTIFLPKVNILNQVISFKLYKFLLYTFRHKFDFYYVQENQRKENLLKVQIKMNYYINMFILFKNLRKEKKIEKFQQFESQDFQQVSPKQSELLYQNQILKLNFRQRLKYRNKIFNYINYQLTRKHKNKVEENIINDLKEVKFFKLAQILRNNITYYKMLSFVNIFINLGFNKKFKILKNVYVFFCYYTCNNINRLFLILQYNYKRQIFVIDVNRCFFLIQGDEYKIDKETKKFIQKLQ